jgi:CRP-like cAMP-binding protein
MLNVIEKVLILQDVDVLSNMTSEQLSFIAAIAEEISLGPNQEIYREGDPPDGLYVVISGSVAMFRGETEIDRIKPAGALGVWALFDDIPMLTTAKTVVESKLLFVPREHFYNVLSDHVDIVERIFKQLAERVRKLATKMDSNHEISDPGHR